MCLEWLLFLRFGRSTTKADPVVLRTVAVSTTTHLRSLSLSLSPPHFPSYSTLLEGEKGLPELVTAWGGGRKKEGVRDVGSRPFLIQY